MIKKRWLMAAASAAMLAGCSGGGPGGFDGVYCTKADMKVVLKDGILSSEGKEASYKVDGENVLVTTPFGQTITYRRLTDGSLSSGAVTLTKCAG